jgi:hypothetical protein
VTKVIYCSCCLWFFLFSTPFLLFTSFFFYFNLSLTS